MDIRKIKTLSILLLCSSVASSTALEALAREKLINIDEIKINRYNESSGKLAISLIRNESSIDTLEHLKSVTGIDFAKKNNIVNNKIILAEAITVNSNGQPRFKDVPKTRWSNKYIETLVDEELAHGKGDGTFGAVDQIKLNEMVAFALRIAGLEDNLPAKKPGENWDYRYVKKAIELGWIHKLDNVNKPITRERVLVPQLYVVALLYS